MPFLERVARPLRTGLRARGHRPPQHLWATVTVVTADGLTAHVHTEFTLRHVDAEPAPGPADPADLADLAMTAVEDVLRRELGGRAATDLPSAGSVVGWVPTDLVPGTRIDHVHVLSSDVEVTPQLHRLLSGCAAS